MTGPQTGPTNPPPLVVLGAGYAGLTVAEEARRRSRGPLPIVLVDRHPVHVLRTQLYEIGALARANGRVARWVVPLADLLDRSGVTLREGTVEAIDLERRTVRVDDAELAFGTLAICLGNVANYYGVPGAREHTETVYRLSGAQRLAGALRRIEAASAGLPGEQRPRVVVVGGGSTGTELAAEVATTDWSEVVGGPTRPPDVFLLTGSLPFLAGFAPSLIDRARRTLVHSGVAIVPGINVTAVEPNRVHLADGTVLACDLAVWCAGLEAPALVRDLPAPHGKGGRLVPEPTLELPGRPGVFAVGDVVEFADRESGLLVPATAQAALSEARVAARNVVARIEGRSLEPFRYRERGMLVALGVRRGAGRIGGVTLWGRPARLLKGAVEREYSRTAERGEPSGLL